MSFAFPVAAGTHLPTPEGWKAWCEVVPAEIRTCNLPIANQALYHTATSALTYTENQKQEAQHMLTNPRDAKLDNLVPLLVIAMSLVSVAA